MPEISIPCKLVVGRNEIDWFEIEGYRGFGEKVHIDLAKPNGKLGSGLTIIAGPNNSGKSTISEGFQALARRVTPTFKGLQRNKNTNYKLLFKIKRMNGRVTELKTIESGGSETEWVETDEKSNSFLIYVLPSRRRFNPLLNRNSRHGNADRAIHISNAEVYGTRGGEIDRFQERIFGWQRNIKRFNSDLKNILNTLPNWSIEEYPSGDYYLKFEYNGFIHTSDGLGDGLINIYFIVDALYDSDIQQTIVIDEPELSLHPSLQKRVLKYLAEYAKDRQIVITTHSPYFVNFDYLINGARLFRTVKENNLIKIYQLSSESITSIKDYKNDLYNPHVLGLNAKEIFFLADNVILVEGQDDVYCYEKMQNKLGMFLKGEFFGWGVGGANKMKPISKILQDLGYKKVVGILDSDNKTQKIFNDISEEFKDYKYFRIPTKDVIKKRGVEKTAICDKFGELKNEYIDTMKKMFEEINRIFEA